MAGTVYELGEGGTLALLHNFTDGTGGWPTFAVLAKVGTHAAFVAT